MRCVSTGEGNAMSFVFVLSFSSLRIHSQQTDHMPVEEMLLADALEVTPVTFMNFILKRKT